MRRPRVPDELRDRPFTTAEARAAGLTHSALAATPWRHIFLNVWAHVDLEETREFRLQSAAHVLAKDAVCCGLTGAWLLGADVRRAEDLVVYASFPKGRRPRHRPGLVVCQETLEAADITVIGDLRVTTALRTAFDCLRWLRRPEGVVVADALTHAGLVELDELRAYFAQQRRLRNLRRGEAQLDDVEPKSESPMESRTRMRLVLNGVPRPELQIDVIDRGGAFVGRLDMGYRKERTAVEYDGAEHWKQRRADDRRRDKIRALGWEIIVVSADDVYSRGNDLESAVWTSLRRHRPRALSATRFVS